MVISNVLPAFSSFIRGFFYCFVNNIKVEGKVFLGKRPKFRISGHVSFSKRAYTGDNFWLECIGDYYKYKYDSKLIIGNNFSCGNNVHIGCANKISIGDYVLIGSGVLITDHAHGIYNEEENSSSPYTNPVTRELSTGQIDIGDNVWIGDDVKIIGTVTIGSGVIIGAGSIVTKSVPENTIVCGSPAKVIKYWCNERNLWVKSK